MKKIFTIGQRGHPGDVHIWGRPWALAALVAYEAVSGLINTVVALTALLVITGIWRVAPLRSLNEFVLRELQEDPQDMFLNWVAGHFPRISHDTSMHLAWLVLAFGTIKIMLAAGLWYRVKETRIVAVAVFGAFAVYGLYRLFLSFSWSGALMVLIDAFFLYYFWIQLPRHLARDARSPSVDGLH